ncbi:hypothetical protein O3P69_020107 [Scylla paramamosain]|uniref:Uncharacterized protein n=1 Tax=Scylla paramamosain TaxID=85552 RepID=A0AAW0TL88_SCYPA
MTIVQERPPPPATQANSGSLLQARARSSDQWFYVAGSFFLHQAEPEARLRKIVYRRRLSPPAALHLIRTHIRSLHNTSAVGLYRMKMSVEEQLP